MAAKTELINSLDVRLEVIHEDVKDMATAVTAHSKEVTEAIVRQDSTNALLAATLGRVEIIQRDLVKWLVIAVIGASGLSKLLDMAGKAMTP